MRLSFRLVLAACTAAAALTACSDGEQQPAVETIEDVAGVSAVRAVTWADDPGSTYLEVTLDDDLSEDDVREVVDDIKSEFDDDGAPDPGSLQVVVGDFRAGVYPRHSGIENPDPDLERALWLREDGRATWFGPGPHFRPGDRLSRSGTRPLTIAPAADVLALALDLEAAVSTENEVRRSYLVGSPDGSVRVQWSNYPGTLDHGAVEQLVAVQERYPGTTGWYDDSTPDAGVHFDDDDLTLAQTITRGPDLLDGLPYSEVGWGPLRAATFAELGRMARDLGPALGRLRAMGGVRAVTAAGVQVEDLATLDEVRRLLPDETVQLVREPSLFIGSEPDPVIEAGSYTEPSLLRLWKQLAQVDGFRSIRGGLVLESDISDADLARLSALLRPRLAPTDRLRVLAGEAPVYNTFDAVAVGQLLADGTVTPAPPPPGAPAAPPGAEELFERVAQAWADAPAD